MPPTSLDFALDLPLTFQLLLPRSVQLGLPFLGLTTLAQRGGAIR
jgi:hypothetical protein